MSAGPIRRLASLATAYPVALVVLSLLQRVAPRPRGVAGLTLLFAPHLFVLALPLAPLAAATRSRPLAAALTAAGLVGVARFGPRRPRRGRPPDADRRGTTPATRVRLLSWNVLADHRPAASVLDGLLAHDADIVAIQELTPAVARAIADHPRLAARYPARLLDPRGHDVLGMAILSAFPMLDGDQAQRPPRQWATLDLGSAGRLTLVNVHPVPPKLGVRRPARRAGPLVYDPAARDHALRRIGSLVRDRLARGERVIVAGDLNLSDREPAYREITRGLVDAQRAAGRWPGSTWHPRRLARLRFGLLRIDHVFAGPGVKPVVLRVDRNARGSDHHAITATFELGPGAGPGLSA